MALTELQNGRFSRFRLVGKVRLREESFTGPKTNVAGTWFGVNDSFGVEVSEGNVIYPTIQGGYDLRKNFLMKRNKDFKALDVPFADRLKPEWVELAAPNQFVRASIVKNGDHTDSVEFLSEIDYAQYLKENLADGTEVIVTGDADYSWGKDGEVIYRNYRVKNIYLNELETDEDGNQKLKYEHEGYIRQTYLVDDSSLNSQYKKEIEKEGKTVLALHVPSYVGNYKRNGQSIPIKRTVAMAQPIVFKVDKDDPEQVAKGLKWLEALFKVKKNTVREIGLRVKINEGYETVEASNMVISKNTQQLIDAGLFTLEEVEADYKRQLSIRGARTSELIYMRPEIDRDENGEVITFIDEKYDPSALVSPLFDDEEDEIDEAFKEEEEDDSVDALNDDDFESIFGI